MLPGRSIYRGITVLLINLISNSIENYLHFYFFSVQFFTVIGATMELRSYFLVEIFFIISVSSQRRDSL